MIEIRRAKPYDFDLIWPMLHDEFQTGATYPFLPETSKGQAFRAWMEVPKAAYLATIEGEPAGTYYLKPNQPGLGSHVANAGYVVERNARRRGVGRAMGEHSLAEAARFGFRAMQFNLIVGTNIASVELWKSLGFHVVGTLPGAFRHLDYGYVDALVMYRRLEESPGEARPGAG